MNFDSQKGFMIKYWVIYLWEMPFLFPFQCESSLVGPPARCWCVSSWNGKRLLGSSDLVGDSECHQEVTHWRMDSVVTQKPTFTHTKAHTLTATGGQLPDEPALLCKNETVKTYLSGGNFLPSYLRGVCMINLFIRCLYILTSINHLSFLDLLYVCLFYFFQL